jgi:hypothetical protein
MRLRRPSPAMLVALLGLFVALGGSSYAALQLPRGSVGTKQLKNNAVTSKKVKNNSLLVRDFRASQRALLRGPQGERGERGERGLQGVQGVQGPPGTSVFASTIPAGTTVIGDWYAAPSNGNTTVGFHEASFPTKAPAAVGSGDSNMGAGTANAGDADAACTGSAGAPTAPPGKVCWYVGFQVGLSQLEGFGSSGSQVAGAAVRVTGNVATGSTSYARGSWAYTAP